MKFFPVLATLLTTGILCSDLSARNIKENLNSREYLLSAKAREEDDYANSKRRLNYFKNRLIFEVGTGSKTSTYGYPGMFKTFGGAVEYFVMGTGVSAWVGFGMIPQLEDKVPSEAPLQGGNAWRVGLAYTFLPKIPLHPGIAVSYGTAFYDHDVRDNLRVDDNNPTSPRLDYKPLIKTTGWNIDFNVTFLSNDWYYLCLSTGLSFSGEPDISGSNPSLYQGPTGNEFKKTEQADGIDNRNFVIGLTIGYALPDLMPDDIEKKRRAREAARKRLGL